MLTTLLLLAIPALSVGDDWTQWRGPNGTGMAEGDAPLSWSDEENVKWKVEVAGRGFSTPVIHAGRIFLTTAVPTGKESEKSEEEQAAEESRFGGASGVQPEQDFKLLCLNRADGTLLWEKTLATASPHEGYHKKYGSWASPSPLVADDRVYASFGTFGTYCLDLDGELIWSADPKIKMTMRRAFGEGTAPVLHGQSLVIVYDHEGDSAIVAFDKDTGDELWHKDRDEPSTWAQPLVVERDGKGQIVTSGTNKIRSYDPKTGAILWECDGVGTNAIPAPLIDGDFILAMSGYKEPVLKAIRINAKGELAADEVAWSTEKGLSYTCSPVLHDGKLYCLMDRGFISCFDVETGEAHYREERLPRGSNFKASPVGAAGKLYVAAESGDVHVLKLSPDFEVLVTNTLADQFFVSSPVIVGGELFLRSETHLFCIAEETAGE